VSSSTPRTGGQILADQLRIHGADTAFGVPGESYLALLDALHEAPIRLVTCRMEAGAANMAEAYGKLTGRPGICLATRGPGATHASVGVHTARQDSTPMLLIVGQVARAHRGREAFQEVDFEAMFAPLAKWACEVTDGARIPELVSRAFHVACSGRPGPVVLAFPEDVLAEPAAVPDAAPYSIVQAHPGDTDMERLRELLAATERPLVLVGGGGWTEEAARDILAFVEANGLPTVASFRCQSYVDNRSPMYCGWAGVGIDPALAGRIREADLLLVVGARLGEATTAGYTLVEPPRPRQRLVHVHADPDELGSVYQGDLLVNAGPAQFAAAARALEHVDAARWEGWRETLRAEYVGTLEPRPAPGELDLGRVVVHLRERLPADAILANGAGNFTVWLQRFYRFRGFRTQLAPTSGAMGYGVPAAVAAKILHPERTVVCLAGDGDFLMTGQELATAVQEEAAVVVLVVNNGMYGTIRMHQEREYPGRETGTRLVNPDFAAYARSFGAHGEVVERTEDFAEAFERALAAGGPAVLELRVDPEAITPRATLSEIRDAALRRA
jgi:acetolactate synthase-1/2/3 large subunit